MYILELACSIYTECYILGHCLVCNDREFDEISVVSVFVPLARVIDRDSA